MNAAQSNELPSVIVDDYNDEPITERYPSSTTMLCLIQSSLADDESDDVAELTAVSRLPPPPERTQALAAVLATVLLVAFSAAWSPSLAVYASLLTGGALAHWASKRLT